VKTAKRGAQELRVLVCFAEERQVAFPSPSTDSTTYRGWKQHLNQLTGAEV
jgi:hypothetical protein